MHPVVLIQEIRRTGEFFSKENSSSPDLLFKNREDRRMLFKRKLLVS